MIIVSIIAQNHENCELFVKKQRKTKIKKFQKSIDKITQMRYNNIVQMGQQVASAEVMQCFVKNLLFLFYQTQTHLNPFVS